MVDYNQQLKHLNEKFPVVCGRLVRTLTPDRLELRGFLTDPDLDTHQVIFLHLHGMFENFYLPLFIEPLAQRLTNEGSSFLSVNTRAQDYIVYCRQWKQEDSFTWAQQGGSHEIFSNCLQDIDGWIDFCEKIGKRIVLMGHSHGALKSAYYASTRGKHSRISGLILLSPSDDVGLQKQKLDDRYNEALTIAKTLVNNGKGTDFMPPWAYSAVTAAMYVDMFSSDSDLAIFRFNEPSEGFKSLSQINVPTLVIFGENDKATSSVKSQKAIDLIRTSFPEGIPFEGKIVQGANHNYLNHENELCAYITEWANRILFQG